MKRHIELPIADYLDYIERRSTMRHDLRYETKRITRTRRTGTSRNGNPNFEVYFEDATAARTQTDAACAYGIENREVLHPNWVRVGFTRDDRIATVEPTEAPQR